MTWGEPKKTTKQKKACSYCNAQGDRIEECLNCMGYGCLECDQGYVVYDCEYCRKTREKEQAKAQKQAEKLVARKATKKEMSEPVDFKETIRHANLVENDTADFI